MSGIVTGIGTLFSSVGTAVTGIGMAAKTAASSIFTAGAATGGTAVTSSLFGGGAGAAAGGIFGKGLMGHVLSGVASGWAVGAKLQEEQKAQVAKEKRQEARYSGAGQAVRFWDQPGNGLNPNTAQRTNADAVDPTVGGFGSAANANTPDPSLEVPVNQTPEPTRMPRYRFNPDTGQIEYR